MRFAAVFLPWVRVELARARMEPGASASASQTSEPLAIVIARPGGAVKDERSLLGNTRLDEVSPEAYALGVRRGQTIAAARAKTADLRVRVVAMDAVREVLARVAEAGLGFGATTSFDVMEDVVTVDVTGCAHLHDGGEATLAEALAGTVRAMGHACRVAVADGPRVAMAVARLFPRRGAAPIVVPVGENARAMSALPLRALPLDGAAIGWLSKLGVKRVGDLQRLPRSALGTRLGQGSESVMALVRGEDGAPLVAYVPPEVPEERAELEYGITGTEQLLFVAKTLCDRMAARLSGRVMAAARLELSLKLDRAIARDAELPAHAALPLTLPTPLHEAGALLAVLRARVESYVIPAPILAVTLRVTELVRKEARALDLFQPEAKADRALPRLAAELGAELGEAHVGTLSVGNTWAPEGRTSLVPFGQRAVVPPPVAMLSRTPEPARVLGAGRPCGSVRNVKLLSRVEAIEWWKQGRADARDFLAAWVDDERAMAWIEIDRATGIAQLKGWMD
jgi:protein ImuB